ncbi:hypothetical protein DID88_008043 [Monilinia fructigena]|uniref:Luciferase domain-containing protein n=1 Tax=Monilinia fructigena TaxID=38457 RepID=A0A395J987_9HELO|nr:hypothetical protein DID88_008043 [Monilinia fructigena]
MLSLAIYLAIYSFNTSCDISNANLSPQLAMTIPKRSQNCGALGQQKFLREPLPKRNGERPQLAKWVVPHRQINQFGSKEMHKLLDQAIIELAKIYPNHIILTTSALEKHGDALLIKDKVPTPHLAAKKTKREIAHIHTEGKNIDYSMHAVLSPRDCKEIIEKGWESECHWLEN